MSTMEMSLFQGKLNPHCLVLVGSRNGIKRNFIKKTHMN